LFHSKQESQFERDYKMDKAEIITFFFDRIKLDPIIDPVHISLFMTLCHLSNPDEPGYIDIERNSTMSLSKIASPATYFKKLRELSDRGLIEYYPSRKKCRLTRVRLRKEEKDGEREINNIPGFT